MRGKSFFILCLSVFLFCAAGYFIAVDRLAIPDRAVDRSYREFMLKATDTISDKIIVTSGSNSIHSVMAGMIERHFGRPAFMFCDNGTYPLEYRLYTLKNHVSRGDLIILPLEWGYYVRGNNLADIFVSSLLDKFGSNSFYYMELPLYAKIYFVFNHLPPSLALKRVLALNALPRFNKALRQNEMQSTGYIFDSIADGLRGSYIADDGPMEPAHDGSDTLTCDEYILGETVAKGFEISERFRKNLRLLRAMVRETGVRVLFTWPAVVGKTGNECYTSNAVRENLKEYTRRLEEEVGRYGFRFIGDVYESRFDKRCFRDTYFHVRHNCGIKRTERLIELLEEEGVTKKAGYSPDNTNKTMQDYAENLYLPLLAGLDAIPVNTLVENEELTRYLHLRTGWSFPEEWGLWSTGKRSVIVMRKPEKSFDRIRIKGVYYRGMEKTGVWINDTFMGRFFLKDKTIAVKNILSGKDYIRIRLEHKNPLSPSEFGNAGDTRKLKYGLRAVELINDREVIAARLGKLRNLSVNHPVKGRELKKYFLFQEGWSYPEEWGVWSTGERSTIIFSRPDRPFHSIRFKGVYYHGREKTGVWINGTFMGRFFLKDKTIDVRDRLSGTDYIRIRLEHTNPLSPSEFGNVGDTRKLKYGLRAVELISDREAASGIVPGGR